jgi:hypothetical protein
MEYCKIEGLFPPTCPFLLASQLLNEVANASLEEFQCAPTQGEINEFLNKKFKDDSLIKLYSIRMSLSPEEAFNTVCSMSMDTYDPIKKRKLDREENKKLKKMRTVSDEIINCAICLYDVIGKRSKLKCGCEFHDKCIKLAMEYKKQCPLCYCDV